MVDVTSVFDQKAYEDVMNRLRDVRITNKANTEDQLERVHAVTVIVQAKEKVNLNPRNTYARDILNRSTVIEIKDGTNTLYFRPTGQNNHVSYRGALINVLQHFKAKSAIALLVCCLYSYGTSCYLTFIDVPSSWSSSGFSLLPYM